MFNVLEGNLVLKQELDLVKYATQILNKENLLQSEQTTQN